MKHLSLIATILPLLIIAIGLIGWVLSLRNDVSSANTELVEVQGELQQLKSLISSESEIRVDEYLTQSKDISNMSNDVNDRIDNVALQLAVAEDQMKTIMGDHLGFYDILKQLGESGLLPSGERRSYGSYGNN